MLTKAEQKFGDLPLAALNDPAVRQDFMEWRATVARASGMRAAARHVRDAHLGPGLWIGVERGL
jgi:hypothetical protein